MDTVSISAERKAQLEEYASRCGQDPAAVLDAVLEEYLEWDRQELAASVEDVRQGYEDVQAGRVYPLDEVVRELRKEHDLSR